MELLSAVRSLPILCLVWAVTAEDKCRPFPSGQVVHDITSDVIMPGDAMQFDFYVNVSLPASAIRVVINITATSLKFPVNDSTSSVSWQITLDDNTLLDRNSSSLIYKEERRTENVHTITVDSLFGENITFQGLMDMIVTETADAADLVQSTLEVTVTHLDNSTCFSAFNSPYFYLPPPKIWVTSETSLPVPMMQQFQGVVNVLVTNPDSLGPSVIEVRTPSEESSREVILTIQTSSVDHVNGFTDATTCKVREAPPFKRSTFGSFQSDISQFTLPPLQRDAVNFSKGDLGMKFSVRAEDYSELRDGDVVNVSVAVTLGRESDVSGGGGASLIWVNSVAATIQAPPQELKRPELNLTLSQKGSCAYDGETRAVVDVELFHDTTSTATAYNVTARVYLTDAMTLLRHTSSELRQNSLSLTQTGKILYIDIERMTFSDPTTVTLTVDVDLSDSRTRFAKYHVITADAIFADRWGNDTGMFTAIDYVSLQLDTKCSQRLNWTKAGTCACEHNITRTDCACCVVGACQCGEMNPTLCLPCDRLHLCQPFLKGFNAITELDAGDGKTTYICDAYYRYRPWTGGTSCYKRTFSDGAYAWFPLSSVVGAITSRDTVTGNLYGVSNNGLARMLSEDSAVTWYTIPDGYVLQSSSANLVEAQLIPGQLEG